MTRNLSSVAGLVLAGALVGGCGGWDEGTEVELQRLSRTVFTQNDGYARVRVPLDRFQIPYSKMLMASQLGDDGGQTIYVDRIEADGDLLRNLVSDIQESQMRTGAVADQPRNHFNWPITADDEPLSGEEVTIFLGAVNPDRSLRVNAPIDVDVLLADDEDFTSGSLAIRIHYADGLADDSEIVSAVEGAVAVMEETWAPTGIAVTTEYRPSEVGALPRPGFGAPDTWTELTASTTDLSIDVVIVDTIASSDTLTLGAAGSIPGGLLASPYSGVILSASANAGPDLQYSASEVELLGYTLAHEVGHMVGLFHPVELTYDRWDALTDTPECEGEGACQSSLGDNLMYPQALCTRSTCLTQDQITAEQAGVAHRYTGVR